MFTFTRNLRKQRLTEERGNKYSFEKEYNSWVFEHSMFVLFGLFIDVVNGKGPLLSVLLGGVSFMRLLLRLMEKNEPQLWTWPNLITSIRICGVFTLAAYSLHHHENDRGQKAEEAAARQGVVLEEDFIYSDYWVAIYGSMFIALDFLDGFLARTLNQCTLLGSHLDAQCDALGTCFLSLTLLTKGRMNSFLAIHMAAAAFIFSVFPKICPPRLRLKFSYAKHPHARYCAGSMAFLAVLAVLLPIIEVEMVSTTKMQLAHFAGNLAGIVNFTSFTLSYVALFRATKDDSKHEHDK